MTFNTVISYKELCTLFNEELAQGGTNRKGN